MICPGGQDLLCIGVDETIRADWLLLLLRVCANTSVWACSVTSDTLSGASLTDAVCGHQSALQWLWRHCR